MQTVTLTLREKNRIPIEADTISPDNFAGLSERDIEQIPLCLGNTQVFLGDIFEVVADGSDSAENVRIEINGDLSRIKRIGQRMSAGEIVINGNVDMHCGCSMTGGKITINGHADNWVGCEMKGGEITVNGNAKYYVGSGYRGESNGMSGGRIVVNGDVLDYLGEHMCGGEIVVTGNAGLLPGLSNNGGTIVIGGNTTMAAGEMKKGMIVIKGNLEEMLPIYREDGTEEFEGQTYRKFTGDVNVKGKGTLLVK